MQVEHLGLRPRIHASARIAPNAVVCGDVTIGANCSIGFGAVLTAESGPITIGDECMVMDTAVSHGLRGNPLIIGNRVLVGPRAYLSGCEVKDHVFLARGTTVLNGAVLGMGSEVRINGVVHIRTVLPANTTVPIEWIAVGKPVEILPPNHHERVWSVRKPLDFPRYVFGVPRPAEGESMMPTVMPRYAAVLRRHQNDRIVEGSPSSFRPQWHQRGLSNNSYCASNGRMVDEQDTNLRNTRRSRV
jgi:carbonic anhydrase/acetyltransferase-like protein (isoleucine patch superfamily)